MYGLHDARSKIRDGTVDQQQKFFMMLYHSILEAIDTGTCSWAKRCKAKLSFMLIVRDQQAPCLPQQGWLVLFIQSGPRSRYFTRRQPGV